MNVTTLIASIVLFTNSTPAENSTAEDVGKTITFASPQDEIKGGDWPVVCDKNSGIELEFPREFKRYKADEVFSYKAVSPDGKSMIVLLIDDNTGETQEAGLWEKACNDLKLKGVQDKDSMELSKEDLETFRVNSGKRCGFTALYDESKLEGIRQFTVFGGRKALVIALSEQEQWQRYSQSMLFVLDTFYVGK